MKQRIPQKLIMLHLRQAHVVGYMYTHCHLQGFFFDNFLGKIC